MLIDWSDLNKAQTVFLLRASTPAGGRSLTLYEEVHTLKGKEKPRTHKKFLKNPRCILPEGCQPIVVTDAGFRSPWFREVQRLGWDWVGRIRNRDKCQLGPDEPWISCRALYCRATRVPKYLGEALLTVRNALRCRLVIYKAKAKGRKNLTRRGNQPAQSIKSQRNAARNREPWLLATSLPVDAWSAKRIVKIYATRMQIEEAFRDLKNARCGLSLELSGTSRVDRLANLVLVGSLTATFAWLVGKATELARQHRQFQANSTKHSVVLSAIFIGIRAFKDRSIRFAISLFDLALAHLRQSIASYAEQY